MPLSEEIVYGHGHGHAYVGTEPGSLLGVFLRLALGAHAVQLVLVALEAETIALGHAILQHLDGLVFELDDSLALEADEVIVVVLALVAQLVARDAIAEVAHVGEL